MPVEFPTESFSVKFTLDDKDLRRIVIVSMLRRPATLLRLTLFVVIILFGCLLAIPSLFPDRDRGFQVVFSLGTGLALAVAAILGAISGQVRVARKIGALGSRTVTIGPEGIAQEIVGVGTAMRPWSVIQKMIVDSRTIDLYVNEFQMLTIPRHAFGTESEFEAFVERIRGYHPF